MVTLRRLVLSVTLLCLCLLAGRGDAQASASATAVTPCSVNGLASSYDVIVVGSGPGGSVAARRLAESNPTWQILQLERGIPYSACATCQSISGIATLSETTSGPFIFTTPQQHVAGTPMAIKDAAVQGGGSSVNSANHARGDGFRYYPSYYPPNWNWNIMIPYYEKYENYSLPPNFGPMPFNYAANLRGNQGPIGVEQTPLRPFTKAFIDQAKISYPNMPVFYNRSLEDGYIAGVGCSPAEVNGIGQTSVRSSAYNGYISTYTGTNLKTATNTLVTRIIFQGNAVSGVNISFYNTSLGPAYCIIRTKRVVVSAGAFGTPKLLMLSGVGPAAELTALGIPVVANVPAVGQNLNDHFTLFSFYEGYKDNLVDNSYPDIIVDAYYNYEDLGYLAPSDFTFQISKAGPGTLVWSNQRTNMDNMGNVTLASTNPNDPPVINPNYFNNEADKIAAADSIFVLRQMGARLNLTAGPTDPCIGRDCSTPMSTFNAYIQANAYFVGLHYSGTAALCEVTNPQTMRVQGTSGLYALDASVMPKSTAAHLCGSVYAVSERGIDLINIDMHLDSVGSAINEAIGWGLCLLDPYAGNE